VTGFAQDEVGVDVELADGRRLHARFLVGCDGGRSLVRKAAGIEFPGWDPSISSLLVEVEMREELQLGMRHDENGTQAMGRLEDGRTGLVCGGRIRDRGRTAGRMDAHDLRQRAVPRRCRTMRTGPPAPDDVDRQRWRRGRGAPTACLQSPRSLHGSADEVELKAAASREGPPPRGLRSERDRA
jgi:2-polyprenyl-6-methoxyphenol hydroxylase-like FAD-dependent oxidoreductase